MTNDNPPQEDSNEDEDESFTNETDRLKWLGSLMAAFTIIAFFGLIYAAALGYASFEPITASIFTVLALLVLAAGTWTFGIDLIDKYTGE